jgi:hypothetical protein
VSEGQDQVVSRRVMSQTRGEPPVSVPFGVHSGVAGPSLSAFELWQENSELEEDKRADNQTSWTERGCGKFGQLIFSAQGFASLTSVTGSARLDR